jgi:hypothetical protein
MHILHVPPLKELLTAIRLKAKEADFGKKRTELRVDGGLPNNECNSNRIYLTLK